MMDAFDRLPKEQRDIINEYGIHGIKALRNAAANKTPVEQVSKELHKLRTQGRI